MNRAAIVLLLGLIAGGCASDRIISPSLIIGTQVSAFQADLSSYQDMVKRSQSGEQANALNNGVTASQMNLEASRLQTEWALRQSAGPGEAFKILQAQGDTEIATLTATKALPALTSAPMPLDKLGSVAKSMDELSKAPGQKADVEFLVGYATTVKKQIDKSASPPAATPAQ